MLYANTYLFLLHDLIILNNRILRIIQHQTSSYPIRNLYSHFNTLPIDKLFIFQTLLHAHQLVFKSDNLPSFFHHNYIFNYDVHSHSTRNSNSLHRSNTNTTYGTKVSLNLCAKHWSQIPSNLTSLSSFFIFKKQIKNHLLNSY